MNYKDKRELNEWIAEHVMGWRVASEPELQNIYRCGKWWIPDGLDWREMRPHFPHYSSDPAAAMEVLQKCAVACCYLSIEALNGFWRVGNMQPNGEWSKWSDAETLPLAICMFAKKLFSK